MNDILLVRIHFVIEMIWWNGLVPWEFEFPFPGSLISTFLGERGCLVGVEFLGGDILPDVEHRMIRTTTLQRFAVVPRRARI